MKKRESVGRKILTNMHKSPQKTGGIRWSNSLYLFTGFHTCQSMAGRAYSTNSWSNGRHLGVHPAFTKFFKSPEFIYVKQGVFNKPILIQLNGYFCMPLNSCNRGYINGSPGGIIHISVFLHPLNSVHDRLITQTTHKRLYRHQEDSLL